MAVSVHFQYHLRKKFENITFLINAFLLLLHIEKIFCGDRYSCKEIYDISNTDCFNDRIIFGNQYRAGHFVVTKEGTLIIEYSND